LFGCEAEVYVLSALLSDLSAEHGREEAVRMVREQYAIRKPVTSQTAMTIGELFAKYGVGAADPQAFGERVQLA
jgi:hypothetical protein